MDLKFIKKVIGVALLGAAAMSSTNAMAAQANVQIDVNLPTVLVMSPDMRILDRQEGFRSPTQLGQTLGRYILRAERDVPTKVVCR